jgi:hypothetical protein
MTPKRGKCQFFACRKEILALGGSRRAVFGKSFDRLPGGSNQLFGASAATLSLIS